MSFSSRKFAAFFIYHFQVISHLFSTNYSFSELWHKNIELTYISHTKLVLRSQTSNKGRINYEILSTDSKLHRYKYPTWSYQFVLIAFKHHKEDICELMIIRNEMFFVTNPPSILYLYYMKITFSHCAKQQRTYHLLMLIYRHVVSVYMRLEMF